MLIKIKLCTKLGKKLNVLPYVKRCYREGFTVSQNNCNLKTHFKILVRCIKYY